MNHVNVPLDHRLLAAQDVAELLRLPVSTIYELARTGRLPHLRIGRALRFSRQDLEAHLAESCRGHANTRLWPQIASASDAALGRQQLRNARGGRTSS